MARIFAATEKNGNLILEICPSPTLNCADHPTKEVGTSGGGLIGAGPERSPVEVLKDTAAHTLRPFRLVDTVYDLNYKRAAAQAVEEVTTQVAERYGDGTVVDMTKLV